MATPKPALVLLHGIASSGRAWEPLAGALSARFDVHTPTALGHRGRPAPAPRTTLTDTVDDAERYLDEAGLDRPHLVGHSLGGYTAIELARRGRAASVTAFSPAGFWSAEGQPSMAGLRRSVWIARLGAPVLKVVVSTAAGRRLWMGAALCRPESMTARQARAVIGDQAKCTLARRLRIDDDDVVAPLDPLPCPVTVAWAEHDRVLPLTTYREAVRLRLPGASFIVIPDVGHAAMVDDPGSILRTILATVNGAVDTGTRLEKSRDVPAAAPIRWSRPRSR
jgi:pimeloyl-ACP methyl ester carboxylesterase